MNTIKKKIKMFGNDLNACGYAMLGKALRQFVLISFAGLLN